VLSSVASCAKLWNCFYQAKSWWKCNKDIFQMIPSTSELVKELITK
jgi:hypothetical protein